MAMILLPFNMIQVPSGNRIALQILSHLLGYIYCSLPYEIREFPILVCERPFILIKRNSVYNIEVCFPFR